MVGFGDVFWTVLECSLVLRLNLCNMSDLHAAAATAAALGRISTFIPVWEDVSESASLFFAWTWLSELSYSVLEFGIFLVHEEILEKFLRILWARGR